MITGGKSKALIVETSKHADNLIKLTKMPFGGIHVAIEQQRYKTVMMEIMRLDQNMFRRSGKVDKRKLRRLNRKQNKNKSFTVNATANPSEFVMDRKAIEINLMSDT